MNSEAEVYSYPEVVLQVLLERSLEESISEIGVYPPFIG